jgi:hypothetical protein
MTQALYAHRNNKTIKKKSLVKKKKKKAVPGGWVGVGCQS